MSVFVERLKEYMQDLHFTQKDLENKYRLPNATVSGFLHGKTMPTYESLVKLLVAFTCSADFLLGLSEKSFLDVDGLPVEFVAHLAQIIDDYKAK
jgi:transcriptional regulator with XRE-family HTH domain